jgi:hypothetical protein
VRSRGIGLGYGVNRCQEEDSEVGIRWCYLAEERGKGGGRMRGEFCCERVVGGD